MTKKSQIQGAQAKGSNLWQNDSCQWSTFPENCKTNHIHLAKFCSGKMTQKSFSRKGPIQHWSSGPFGNGPCTCGAGGSHEFDYKTRLGEFQSWIQRLWKPAAKCLAVEPLLCMKRLNITSGPNSRCSQVPFHLLHQCWRPQSSRGLLHSMRMCCYICHLCSPYLWLWSNTLDSLHPLGSHLVSHCPQDNLVLHHSEKCCNSSHSKGMFSIKNIIRIT